MAQPTDQVAQITAALQLFLQPGDVTEFRALGVRSNGHKLVMNGYFDDFHHLAEEAVKLSGRAEGTYFCPNAVNPALLARAANRVVLSSPDSCTKDHEIVARRWLLVDIDAVRPRGVSATEEEHSLALERGLQCERFLTEQGWPEPILGDSGNGCHLFYSIRLKNDETATQLVKRVLQALAARFDDDRVKIDVSTYNASRVVKIPFTMASKGDDIATRPWRRAELLKVPTP